MNDWKRCQAGCIGVQEWGVILARALSPIRLLLLLNALALATACGNSDAAILPIGPPISLPTAALSTARADFTLSARVLGPVSSDDNADLRITLAETNGIASRLNFLRLTCSNNAVREWGSGNIAAERGSNRVAGNTEIVLVRHYVCPSSSRPAQLLADLTDDSGFSYRVTAVPYHPDWPGT